MKLNLKEKIFNLLAKKFFGLNYNFSEAKDFNSTKELENNGVNILYKNNLDSIASKALDNSKTIKFFLIHRKFDLNLFYKILIASLKLSFTNL